MIPWEGQGRELYRHEPVFRESVDRSAGVAKRLGFLGIADRFRSADPGAVPDLWHEGVHHAVLHVALIDLWRSVGVTPDGVLGTSLGDMSASYAAGVLSREAFVASFGKLVHCFSREPWSGALWNIEADTATARRLCAQAPAPLYHVATYGPELATVMCDEQDEASNGEFLSRQTRVQVQHRMEIGLHLPRPARLRRAVQAALADASPAPARCAIYSSAAGRRLPADADLGALHWNSICTQPIYFDEAFAAALRDGYNVILTIGGSLSAITLEMRRIAERIGADVTIIDSLHPTRAERETWEHALHELRSLGAIGRRRRRAIPTPAAVTPTPQTIDLDDPEVTHNPFPYLEALRRQGPVHWLAHHDAYLVLNHADVKHILTEPETYALTEIMENAIDRRRREEPAALRRLMAASLQPSRVDRIAGETRALATKLVQRRDGFDLDVVTDLAAPLADHVAGRLVGLESDTIRVASSATKLGRRLPTLGLFDEASAVVLSASGGMPRVNELQGTSTLSEAQAQSYVRGLWVAAALTTRLALGSAVLLLLQEPQLQTQLRADPDRITAFVEEALRLHPPALTTDRIATADTALAGMPLAAGSKLYVCLGAANRDPACFGDPASLRLDRPTRHVTFGHGPHRCPGARVAQRTMAAGVAALLETGRPIREAEPLSSLRWMNLETTHALESLLISTD